MFTMFLRLLVLLVITSFVVGHRQKRNIYDEDMKLLEELEDLIHKDGNIQAYLGHCEDKHQQLDGRSPKSLLNQFNGASRSPIAIRKLGKFRTRLQNDTPLVNRLSKDEVDKLIIQIDDVLGQVNTQTTCDASTPYRTLDGSCNNLVHTEIGMVETPLTRVVGNAYGDGVGTPRTLSVNGGPLPSARTVSLGVFDGSTETTSDFTSLGVHFGQITDHDLSAVNRQQVDCSECAVEGECFAITFDSPDPVFGGKSCLDFTRAHHETDSNGVRQQLNSITTWLDASFVYGSSDMTADTLTDECGSMVHLTDSVTGRPLLPPNTAFTDCFGIDAEQNIYCGLAGDGRAAEQPGLTSLHTLFLREHNRIAAELRALRPTSTADEVFHKARKIVGAEWQHILYNEYLPQIIGATLYNANELGPDAPYEYNPAVDASIANMFAAAGFRFGHTEVPDTIIRAGTKYRASNIPPIQMSEAFFNASYIFDESIPDGAVDSILRGMTIQELDLVDGHLTSAIIDNLFGDPDATGDGLDLAALNIQRGREHGLPSYAVIREEFCGASAINDYSDLTDIGGANLDKLKQVYGDNGVRDIDAFAGLILEDHLPNALVGPTLACIFADQFKRLKFGDRFFYKNSDQFTVDEIEEIQKATFARLMCDNVEGVTKIQPFVFVAPKNFQTKERRYNSFHEYSKSGDWPHTRSTILNGLNNHRKSCSNTNFIPKLDINRF
ncbi:peroxidasin-like [Asterias rubens]|uniref:peroxidasin-like n=1 Tax=Asterias rubens TaxID=7604 RepID=UPI001454F10E|nr:peroxidasin-like [Asterias rubens]